ncbi:MAG: cytochrome c oxidase assembly protein, partial [Brevundimonas sp.]
MNNPGRKNLIAIVCVLGVMGMTGAAFAAVPLYRMFCQVTGFDGTVRRADKAPDTVLDQTVLVRFDTNVRGLPMTFRAEQTTQRVRIGETGLAYFDVTNTSDQPIQVRAGYNVVPEYTGPYFQ